MSLSAPWTTRSRMVGIESWRTLPPPPSGCRPSAVVGVDSTAAPAPHEAGRETRPRRLLRWLRTSPITARGAVVVFRQLIGSTERLVFADVAIQAPKSPRWFGLRLDVESSSQVLQRDGCLCHLTPASRC